MTDPVRESVQHALGADYRIDRELGGGGMSRVFIAHDTTLDRDVVVKVLSGEMNAGVSGDRFRREIQVIAKLQHPHIVSILTAGDAGNALYFVMPYVGGETLRARMQREGALPVATVVRTLREILEALAFAHDHGVVHRDIKPENVLLEANYALVADFGIAKALSDAGNITSAGMALGTPAYMAPEQATGDPSTDHRADLYSVGVMAYELLTGAPLFSGSAHQLIAAHITTPAPSVAPKRHDVPAALAALIARTLEKAPDKRPQSAQEMIDVLALLGTGEGEPRLSGSTHRSRTRSRMVLGGLVGVAAIAVAAFAVKSGKAVAPTVASGAELIAVMPLGAVSDTSLARLGQDLAVTLSANFDGVGALRSIDAATLLMKARNAASPMPLSVAQQLAAEVGAGSVMTGTLINVGNQVQASVVLFRVGTDTVLAKASALAAPHDIAALTDSLSWAVLQQVWRRGNAPSPVLTGLTTTSFDALRAFLDGERKFQRLDIGALADYRRAFELDSNFVQAFLRFDYVNSWFLLEADSAVHARLITLAHRLPERERLWVQTEELNLPLPAQVEKWKALAKQYPDYPPFLMAAADPIIHRGPIYGIPMSDARPMLDKLDQLVPDHADTKMHLGAEMTVNGDATEAARVLKQAGTLTGGAVGEFIINSGIIYEAAATGSPLPGREQQLATSRKIAASVTSMPFLLFLVGDVSFARTMYPQQLEILNNVRSAGIYTGELAKGMAFSEGNLRAGRGDWRGAITVAKTLQSTSLPLAIRNSAARLAGLGAWLEAVDVRVADTVVRRALQLESADANTYDRTELRWLNGVVGVVEGNEVRVRNVISELLRDTSLVAQHTARSLAGLWLYRTNQNAGADTLRAVTDDVMQRGGYLLSVESVNRLVIARALQNRNESEMAERYLMWTDAIVNTPTTFATATVMRALNEYERGAAQEASGNRSAAIKHYKFVVDNYDQAPPAHHAMVADAKSRLAALEKPDAVVPKTIPTSPSKGSPP